MTLFVLAAWYTPDRWPAVLFALTVAGGLIGSRWSAKPGRSWLLRFREFFAPVPALVCLSVLGVVLPGSDAFGNLTVHGPRGGNLVAITFDDGPNPTWTPKIMALLDQEGVEATFFSIGQAVEDYPDVAKSLKASGHLIANHSYKHSAWSWLSLSYDDGARAEQAIKRTLGVCPAFFRPPHGSKSPAMLKSISDSGLKTVTWDVAGDDWRLTDPTGVADRVLEQVKPGSIILLHDGLNGDASADRAVVLQALPQILAGLKAKGLTPVRLDELLSVPGYLDSC